MRSNSRNTQPHTLSHTQSHAYTYTKALGLRQKHFKHTRHNKRLTNYFSHLHWHGSRFNGPIQCLQHLRIPQYLLHPQSEHAHRNGWHALPPLAVLIVGAVMYQKIFEMVGREHLRWWTERGGGGGGADQMMACMYPYLRTDGATWI